MNFATMKIFFLPEGEVVQVDIKGNQVPLSIDETGAIFGYANGKRVRSTGELADATYGAATGYISVNPGDIVSFSGGNWLATQTANTIHLSDESFGTLGYFTQQPGWSGVCTQANSVVTEKDGVYTYTIPADSRIKYLRMSIFAYDTNQAATHGKDLSVITSSGLVTVWAKPKNLYTVALPTGEGYTATASSGSESPVVEGGSYSFTVVIADGYVAGDGFAVKANGVTLTAVDGVYTIENITTNQTITVDGVVVYVPPADAYTNLVPTSIDTDGSIYNGTGYNINSRLSSSGAVSSGTNGTITGFIKVKPGDVVRFASKGDIINWPFSNATNCIHCYNSSKNSVGRVMGNGTVSGVFNSTNATVTEEVYRKKYRLTVPDDSSIEWIRVGVYGPNGPVGGDLIVTANQEITD